MRRLAGLMAATALLLLTGCTGEGGSPTTPSPTTVPSAPSTSGTAVLPSIPPSAGTPTATSTGLVPGADCLNGSWRLVRFVGLGERSTYGTGQGGDVAVAFDQGRYTLAGRGRRPITVNLAGSTANLLIDGTVDGTYQPDGAEMSFTIGKATGRGTLQAGDQRQNIPMAQIAQVVAPSGRATLACPSGVLLIALPTVRLELER